MAFIKASPIKSKYFKKLFQTHTVDSTNQYARELVKSEKNNFILLAQAQNKGKGQFDHSWFSPKGGLYCSLVLFNNEFINYLSILPILTALSVANVLKDLGLKLISIKWPNDILIENKKIAGVLIESKIQNNAVEYLIIGIGLNLNISINVFPLDIQKKITTVYHEVNQEFNVDKVLTRIIREFDSLMLTLKNKGSEKIITLVKQFKTIIGKKVRITTDSRIYHGIVHSMATDGSLILNMQDKKIRIYSGIVTVLE